MTLPRAVARLCGLPGKVGIDGSQVEGLYRAGQLAAIQSYCLADITQTAFVFLRFRLLQGILSYDAYRRAVTNLLSALEADFVSAARSYSERKGISYAAWRAVGVPPAVLKKAGISRTS